MTGPSNLGPSGLAGGSTPAGPSFAPGGVHALPAGRAGHMPEQPQGQAQQDGSPSSQDSHGLWLDQDALREAHAAAEAKEKAKAARYKAYAEGL